MRGLKHMCRTFNTAFRYFPSPLSQASIPGGIFKRFKKTESNEIEKWSIHSSLHGDVSCLLKEDDLHFNFHDIDDTKTFINDHDTSIMRKFKYLNGACKSKDGRAKGSPSPYVFTEIPNITQGYIISAAGIAKLWVCQF